MTPTINIVIPESLLTQKTELEATLVEITRAEEKLAVQRKEINTVLTAIASGIAVLSGQPIPPTKPVSATGRKPMSPEAKQRIAEGLRKSRVAKAQAAEKSAPASIPSPDVPAPGLDTPTPTTEKTGDTPTEKRREPRASRKQVRLQ